MTDGALRASAIYTSIVSGGIEGEHPGAFAALVQEGCLVPLIKPGDKVLVSRTITPQPGRPIFIRTRHDDGQIVNYLKILLCPIPWVKDGHEFVAVEMFDPPDRFGIDMARVIAVYAVVGLSRGGREPFAPFRAPPRASGPQPDGAYRCEGGDRVPSTSNTAGGQPCSA